MKNKLIDLNNHLFLQLERLSSEELKGDALKEEMDRSKVMAGVAREIIDNAKLAFEVQKAVAERTVLTVPAMLSADKHDI